MSYNFTQNLKFKRYEYKRIKRKLTTKLYSPKIPKEYYKRLSFYNTNSKIIISKTICI